MQERLRHARDNWLQAYYDGDVPQLARHEHPQFQLHNRFSGQIEGSERHQHIAFAVAHQAWKPARWHIASERFQFSDDGLTCHVEAEASVPAALIQEFWMYDGAWHIVQLVLSALDTAEIEADEAETAVLTGRL